MNITLENCYSVMLAEGNKHETVKERKKIEELLKKQNVPLFEKIIEAQIKYAGVSYCKYEKDEDEAYRLDLFNGYRITRIIKNKVNDQSIKMSSI